MNGSIQTEAPELIMEGFDVALGPIETALIIMGGNWNAEGACELVSGVCPGLIEATPEAHGEGWAIALHFESGGKAYVQA